MAITGPTVFGGTFGNNVTTLAFSPTTTVPNGSIFFIAVAAGAIPSLISDTAGNVYQGAAGTDEGGSGVAAQLYVVQGAKQLRTTDTITITFTNATNAAFGGIFFTGATNVVDSGSAGFGPGNPVSVACQASAGEVLVAAICVNGPASDGFTQDANFSSDFGSGVSSSNFSIHGGTRSAILAGTFTYRPTLGANRSWVGLMASFK